MGFSLIALLTDESFDLTIDGLASNFNREFCLDQRFSYKIGPVSFKENEQYILLSRPNWGASVYLETGEFVQEDSEYIADFAPPELAQKIAGINRRIRFSFGDDDDKIYTNEIIMIWEIIENIGETIIFDPQENKIL
jgi:hypothetical protein